MNKHETILAIQQLQADKGCAVQHYDVLNRYKEEVLQEQFVLLSPPTLQIDYVTASNLMTLLRTTNGFSYSPATGKTNPEEGYMVAMINYGKIIGRIWNTIDLKHVLNLWMSEIGFSSDPKWWTEWNAYIGAWEHDNKLHIDLSQHIPDKEIAIALGQSRKQIAIWDNKNKCVIKTS